jgi:RNA polymerase sigma factor (TIGR02999 family)
MSPQALRCLSKRSVLRRALPELIESCGDTLTESPWAGRGAGRFRSLLTFWNRHPLCTRYFEGLSDITCILNRVQQGDAQAAEELLPLVYEDLRCLAARRMARERPGQTLQATALVHEAWLRIAGDMPQAWDGRRHFFAAAANAMRRILVENARRKRQLKRGGQFQRVDLEGIDLPAPMPDDELLALDEALTRLAEINPRAADLVKLCFFVGLTQEQAARELGVSISTAERLWAYARAWLFDALHQDLPSPPAR